MCLRFQFCTHQRVCILYFLKKSQIRCTLVGSILNKLLIRVGNGPNKLLIRVDNGPNKLLIRVGIGRNNLLIRVGIGLNRLLGQGGQYPYQSPHRGGHWP